jgi:hypothetical protein
VDLATLLAQLSGELPATVSEIDQLLDQTRTHINVYQARHAANQDLSPEEVAELRSLVEGAEALNAARTELATAEAAHTTELSDLLARAAGGGTEAEAAEAQPEGAEAGDAEAEVVAEAEAATAEAAEDREPVTAGAPTNGSRRPVSFVQPGTGGGAEAAPATPEGPGWQMVPGAPKYRDGRIGFRGLAEAIDEIAPGSRRIRGSAMTRHDGFEGKSLAKLERDTQVIDDPHALVAAIEAATTLLPNGEKPTAQSLVAAGGWCAPSEQLYDFCDVPDAQDLISLPEITINRGGVRWPVEPDLTQIFKDFQFFFPEVALEAVDGSGNPTAIKNCVEIPCPDEFEEIRLNAVGYCIEAGILQAKGWPELIEWFLRQITQEHFRAISRRTILDMVNGSEGVRTINSNTTVGATSAILNSLALMATNLRGNKGLARNATIEVVAPNWLPEAVRADLAMSGDDLDNRSVSDAQILGWLSDRNLALQLVGDWQTRDDTQPGNMDTLKWPGHIDFMLYPAGTWFRSMSPVIELGGLYPKEQLQVNRYTHVFHEDAIAVGKRCNRSVNLRVPLCVNGAIGNRVTITCTDTAVDSGQGFSGAPVTGGQAGLPVNKTLTVTGAPTGGSFKLTYDGDETAAIAYNATAAAVAAALEALPDYSADDFSATGGPLPGTAVVITTPGGPLSVTSPAFTGGTSPAAAIS